MTDRDRLAEVKARYGYDPSLSDQHDVFWLIAELEAAWERVVPHPALCKHNWQTVGYTTSTTRMSCIKCGMTRELRHGY
jgi:hypothetical protein